MTWLYALMIYPVLPLMYVQMRNEVKAKKNTILGVTLPYSVLGDPETELLCAAYKHTLLVWLILLHALFALCLFLGKMSYIFGGTMLWMMAVLGVYFGIYVRYHNKLHVWKLAQGLSPAGEASATDIRVDIETLSKSAPKNSVWWYAFPIAISLALPLYFFFAQPQAADRLPMLIGSATITFMIVLCMATDIALRRRSEAVSEESEINTALTQARRGHWRRCCLWCSYLTAFMGVLLILMVRKLIPEFWGMAGVTLYVFGILYISLKCEFACRHAQERLAGKLLNAVDTDAQWPLGMFYYNKKDPHLLVHARVGTNSTFNLARPLGKLIMGFCALCILSIPLIAAFLISEETSGIQISAQQEQLTLKHGLTSKEISLAEVSDVELLETLPKSYRVIGTGLPNLLKGTFTMEGYAKSCYFCLDPGKAPFVTFLSGGERYVFNYEDVKDIPELGIQK